MRKKVKLAYITNDSARRATFNKRQKGLMKKVDELSKLCGIDACAIIYSPYDSQPQVWPDPEKVDSIVSKFRMLPEMDQSRKMVNQESYLRQRISKTSDQIRRQTKDNREKEITEVMYQCLVGNMGKFHFNIMDLNDLEKLIDQFLKDINRQTEILMKSDNAESSDRATAAATTTRATAATIITAATATATTLAVSNAHQDYQTISVCNQTGPGMTSVDSMEKHQRQLCMELMDRPEQMSFAAKEMTFPPMYNNNSNNNAATAVANVTRPTVNTTTTAGPSVWSTGFSP